MEECKICNKEFNKPLGLSLHLRSRHDTNILDHHIRFKLIEVPTCEICGKSAKAYNTLKFRKTCGGKSCKKKFRESMRHTEDSKRKMRDSRYKYIKNNPEKVSWMLRNQASYPEKVFIEALKKYGLFEKFEIVREKSFYPYFADFAFENVKVVVEIDGQQHFRYQERIDSDKKKDELITSQGWRVYRVKASQVLNKMPEVIDEVLEFIGDVKNISKTSEIITDKERKDIEKQERRRIKREKREMLVEERGRLLESIDTTKLGWLQMVADEWGMSHTSAKRWIRKYHPDVEYYQRDSAGMV